MREKFLHVHASLQRLQCLKLELAACAFRAPDDSADAPLAAPPKETGDPCVAERGADELDSNPPSSLIP